MTDPKKVGDKVTSGTPQSAETVCRACHGRREVGEATRRECDGAGLVTTLVGDA